MKIKYSALPAMGSTGGSSSGVKLALSTKIIYGLPRMAVSLFSLHIRCSRVPPCPPAAQGR